MPILNPSSPANPAIPAIPAIPTPPTSPLSPALQSQSNVDQNQQQLAQLMSQLHDIELPQHLSALPPAPAWYVIPSIILALAVAAFLFICSHKKNNAFRKQAFAELKQLEQGLIDKDFKDAEDYPLQLSHLLKRVAMTISSREQVAKLSGDSWLKYLEQLTKKSNISFDSELGQLMGHELFKKSDNKHLSQQQLKDLTELCQAWIKAVPTAKQLTKELS